MARSAFLSCHLKLLLDPLHLFRQDGERSGLWSIEGIQRKKPYVAYVEGKMLPEVTRLRKLAKLFS
jgi:hypothetical protein